MKIFFLILLFIVNSVNPMDIEKLIVHFKQFNESEIKKNKDQQEYITDALNQVREKLSKKQREDNKQKCIICKKKYINLQLHIERVHINEKIICSCGEKFSSKKGYTLHLRKKCTKNPFLNQEHQESHSSH